MGKRQWLEQFHRETGGEADHASPVADSGYHGRNGQQIALATAGEARWAVYRWSGNPRQQQGKLVSTTTNEDRARKDFEVHAGMGKSAMVRLYRDGQIVDEAVRR